MENIDDNHDNVAEEAIVTDSDQASHEKSLKRQEKDKMYKSMQKYWYKRYALFSRFDEGIRLDYESWFSVTPEWIAQQQVGLLGSVALGNGVVVDAFCGAGGNTIAFGLSPVVSRVVAVDNDEQKLALARHNCGVYGLDVESRVKFLCEDVYCKMELLRDKCTSAEPHAILEPTDSWFPCDVFYLSPPWGGPDYLSRASICVTELLSPAFFNCHFLSLGLCERVLVYLPRNCRIGALLAWAREEERRLQSAASASSVTLQLIQHWDGDSLTAISVLLTRNVESSTSVAEEHNV